MEERRLQFVEPEDREDRHQLDREPEESEESGVRPIDGGSDGRRRDHAHASAPEPPGPGRRAGSDDGRPSSRAIMTRCISLVPE